MDLLQIWLSAWHDNNAMFCSFIVATAFAMTATERNTNFQPEARELLPQKKKLIVYCCLGGTLKVRLAVVWPVDKGWDVLLPMWSKHGRCSHAGWCQDTSWDL